MLAVKTTDLTKKYGKYSGIEQVNLLVEAGDLFGIVGKEGAGKTTLLRLLMNFIFPTNGNGNIFGFDIENEAIEVKEVTAYVPAEVTCYPQMKAGKYIKTAMKMHGVKNGTLYRELVTMFDIPERESFDVMDRIDIKATGIVGALALSPKVLLLDEPTKDLDNEKKELLFQYLLEKNANGMTIVITGENMEELDGFCNRIAIMKNGELTGIQEHDGDLYVPLNDQHESEFEDTSMEDTARIPGLPLEKNLYAEINESEFEEIEDEDAFSAEPIADEMDNLENLPQEEESPQYEEQSIEEFLADNADLPQGNAAVASAAEGAEVAAPIIAAGIAKEFMETSDAIEDVDEVAMETSDAVEDVDEVAMEISDVVENVDEEAIETSDAVEDVKEETAKTTPNEKGSKEVTAKEASPTLPKGISASAFLNSDFEKNIKVTAKRFNKKAFEDIGMRIVSEEKGKVKLAYAGNLEDLAKKMKELGFENYTIKNEELKSSFMALQEDPKPEKVQDTLPETTTEVLEEATETSKKGGDEA